MGSLEPAPRLDRLESRVAGLDLVLGGGFFRSGVYIIQGHPGSGKTILANQICFARANEGEHSVYVTLLAESHTRMLQHLRPMHFFDESVIPEHLSYISAFHDLETEGLRGLLTLSRREMRARSAGVLVLDGLLSVTPTSVSALELKKFVHEMQTSAVFHGCTVFLLTSGKLDQVDPEHTVVDGLIELEERLWGVRAERSLQVRKFRGSSALRGLHSFQIRDDGMTVFPRIEALFTEPPVAASGEQVLSSGVMTLDRMIGQGGLPRSGATVVVGSTGTGKTTFGLHFLSQSTIEEPGLFFGFFESPDRLRSRGPSLGIDIAGLEAQGALKLVWQPQGEHLLDELGHRLLTEVTNGGIKRLVIDGLASFFEAALERERIGRFFSCLVNELRRRGVTLISTLETRDAVGSVVPTPYGVSAIVDSLIFLRYADAAGELKRLVSILKVRGSDFDPTVREMRIASAGIVIGRRFTMPDSIVPDAHPVVDGPEEVHNEGPSAQRGEDADST